MRIHPMGACTGRRRPSDVEPEHRAGFYLTGLQRGSSPNYG